MLLTEQLEDTGGRLFRWRSYLPLVMGGVYLLALRDYEYPGQSESLDHFWEGVCLAISALGLAIRAFTIGHTPKGTSGRTTKRQIADTLNTRGAYSVVRNPLYLGNFFMGLGVAAFAHLWWLTLIYVLAFWLYYERIIAAEEAFLRNKFGHEYLDWAASTPTFIPKLGQYRKADLPFSWRTVLKRESDGFLAVLSAMFCLEVAGDFVVAGEPHLDMGWLVLVSIGFIVWLALKTLKKFTTVLRLSGR